MKQFFFIIDYIFRQLFNWSENTSYLLGTLKKKGINWIPFTPVFPFFLLFFIDIINKMSGYVYFDEEAYEQEKEERLTEYMISEGLRMMEEEEREAEEFDLMYGDDQDESTEQDVQDDDYVQDDYSQEDCCYDDGCPNDDYSQDAYYEDDDDDC